MSAKYYLYEISEEFPEGILVGIPLSTKEDAEEQIALWQEFFVKAGHPKKFFIKKE